MAKRPQIPVQTKPQKAFRSQFLCLASAYFCAHLCDFFKHLYSFRSPRALVPALLVLNDCDIATAGEKDALVAKCSNVEELDLAKNKLDQWTEVSEHVNTLRELEFVLKVSQTRPTSSYRVFQKDNISCG